MATTKNHFKTWTAQRTPIETVTAIKEAYCHRCKANVMPKILLTKFLSAPLHACPTCHSVVQEAKPCHK